MNASNFLQVAALHPSVKLLDKLPPEVARQCRALPIAWDGVRLTVAMAHPEDARSRQVVLAHLNMPACFVQADEQQIDGMIEGLWRQHDIASPRVLLCVPAEKNNLEAQAYAWRLAALIDAEVSLHHALRTGEYSLNGLLQVVRQNQADLVIFYGVTRQTSWGQLCCQRRFIARCPASLLLVNTPCWPLEKLLLTFIDGRVDFSAVKWALRLARASGAAVTIMPVVPHPPLAFAAMQAQAGIDALLTSESIFGQQLRRVAEKLVNLNIPGTLCVRQGEAYQQLHEEISQYAYSLVVVPGRKIRLLPQYLLYNLPARVNARRVAPPVLVTKSI